MQTVVDTGLKSAACLANYRELWRLLDHLDEATRHLELVNLMNQHTSGFQLIAEEAKRHSVVSLLIELLDSTYELIKQNISRHCLVVGADGSGARRVWALVQAGQVIWSWSDRSPEFCHKFHELGGLKALFKFINDNTLVFHLVERKKQQNLAWNSAAKGAVRAKSQRFAAVYEHVTAALKALCGAVHNLSACEGAFKRAWAEVEALRSLSKLAGVVWDEGKAACLGDIDLIVFVTIVHLARFKHELDGLADRYLPQVCALVKAAGHKLATEKAVERCLYKLRDRAKEAEVLVICSAEKTKWRLTELLHTLLVLVDLDEDLRSQVSDSLLFSLKQILFNGNEAEKEHVLRLVWKLCLGRELLDEIRADKDLCTYIAGLGLNRSQISRETHKYCQLILYCLRLDPPQADGHKTACAPVRL